jgi:competence protein ComFC
MSIISKLKQAAANFWQAMTPDRMKCVACGRELQNAEQTGLCEKCFPSLPLTGSRVCEKCGVKIGGESRHCERCSQNQHSFGQCRSVCEFDGLARQMVHSLKFGGKRYLSQYMAHMMSEAYKNTDWDIDAVTFVPMTERAQKKRGYNQAGLLSKRFCDIIDMPLKELLIKSKETDNQTTLSFRERQENIHKAFEIVDKNAVKGKNVLVIDDVKTTGATLDEIAAVLKKNGAKEVYGLTFASRTQKADLH